MPGEAAGEREMWGGGVVDGGERELRLGVGAGGARFRA